MFYLNFIGTEENIGLKIQQCFVNDVQAVQLIFAHWGNLRDY